MPSRPVEICNDEECDHPTVPGTDFCAKHTKHHNHNVKLEPPNPVYTSARWRRLRKMVIAEEPMCRYCEKATRVVDHIVPISMGGSTWNRENLQGVCQECHNRKRQEEQRISKQVAPEGKFNRSVQLICGPPLAGKSSFAKSQLQPGIIMLDFDLLLEAIGGSRTDPKLREPYIRPTVHLQRSLLGWLCSDLCTNEAIIVLTAPTALQRAQFQRAGAEVTIVYQQPNVLRQRIQRDLRRARNQALMNDIIDNWFRKFTPGNHDKVIGDDIGYQNLCDGSFDPFFG